MIQSGTTNNGKEADQTPSPEAIRTTLVRDHAHAVIVAMCNPWGKPETPEQRAAWEALTEDDFPLPWDRNAFMVARHLRQSNDVVRCEQLGDYMLRLNLGASVVERVEEWFRGGEYYTNANIVHDAKALKSDTTRRSLSGMAYKLNQTINGGGDLADVYEAARAFAHDVQVIEDAGESADRPMTVGDLLDAHPDLHPAIIEGLIRRGETANIIAASKVGKSWLTYYIAICIILGLDLFDAYRCTAGRVLLIDNELHRPSIANRIRKVVEAMGVEWSEVRDRLEVWSLRGRGVSITDLRRYVDRIQPGQYAAIICDAWYRFIPRGMNENSNADVMALYNQLDAYAAQTDAAWIAIHHTSKGSQGEKNVTDVGSGAGSQSRAADAHIILREHEEPGHVVLDAAVRSFAPVSPLVLRWNFPLWEPAYLLNPDAVKGRKTKGEQRQDERDTEGKQTILDALADGPLNVRAVRSATGYGAGRAERLLDMLTAEGKVEPSDTTGKGGTARVYSIA